MAARAPDGDIVVDGRDFTPFSKRHPLLALPVVRGAASLVEALVVGGRALNWSAGVQEKSRQGGEGDETTAPSSLKDKALSVLMLLGSVAFALGLFQLLPYASAAFIAGGTRENPANPV